MFTSQDTVEEFQHLLTKLKESLLGNCTIKRRAESFMVGRTPGLSLFDVTPKDGRFNN